MSYPFTSIQTWKYFEGRRLEDALRKLTEAVGELTDVAQEDINCIHISPPTDENPFYTAGCIFSWKEGK